MAVAEAPKSGTATGSVIAITGPVVDIEFPAGHLPSIFNAVELERPGSPLVCEVSSTSATTGYVPSP
jgi:F-type H+-transporting ATPase subunit beta